MCRAHISRVLLLSSAVIIAFAGCNQTSSPTDAPALPQTSSNRPPVPADSVVVDTISVQFPIDTIEGLTGPLQFELRRMRCGPGCYIMYLRTTYDLGCINYRIVEDTRIGGRHISIDIAGITLKGGVCLTALGPAVAEIWMPTFTPGRYQLHFTYEGQRDHYQLVVDDDYDVEIIEKRSQFTNPVAGRRAGHRDPCDPEPGPESYPPTDTEPLHGDVEFYLGRTRCGPGVYALHMRTDYELPCANYWIAHRTRVRGHRIDVDVAGISLGDEVCLQAIKPAYGNTLLPELTPGNYQMVFMYGHMRDHYQVLVDDDYRVRIVTRRAEFTFARVK